MTFYRRPVYLDTDLLVPIANQFSIDVDTAVELTQKDTFDNNRRLSAASSLPGIANLGGEAGKVNVHELTQTRTITAHPGAALNQLIERLNEEGSAITDIDQSSIQKNSVIHLEGDWSVSPVTDTGAIFGTMLELFKENPSLINNKEVPNEFTAQLFSETKDPNGRQIVLTREKENEDQHNVIALLDSDNLIRSATEDDLEDDRTILGLVETFKVEGSFFNLEKFFMPAMPRALRRKMPLNDLYSQMAGITEGEVDKDSLKYPGPLIVIRTIAIYP